MLVTKYFPGVVKGHVLHRVSVTFNGPLKVPRLIVPHLYTKERGLVTLYTTSPYLISPYHYTLIVASSEHDNIKLKRGEEADVMRGLSFLDPPYL